MLKGSWRKWTALLASGAMLLALPSCAEYTASLVSLSQIVTGTGVLFLVQRITE